MEKLEAKLTGWRAKKLLLD